MKTTKHFSDRRGRLFSAKPLRRLPAILLTSQPNVFYFTAFAGDDSWAILTPKKTTIITDGRYAIQARQQAPGARTIVRRGSIVNCLTELLKHNKIRRIGFTPERVSVRVLEELQAGEKSVRWLAVAEKQIFELRQTKSTVELARIRKALAISQGSFLELLAGLKPGTTEMRAAAELDYRMRLAGADESAFETIVACGKNSAKPHAVASSAKIAAGKPIVIDFGARVGQYCCDLTRTVWFGRISRQFRKVYNVCLQAQLEAIAAIRPGVRACEIDKIARRVISRARDGR